MSELDAALEGLRIERRGSRLRGLIHAVWAWMPQGQLLPEHIWRRRHKTIVYLMWFHVVFLTTFGLVQGQTVPHMMFEASLLIAPAPPPRSASSPRRRCSYTSPTATSRRTSTSS
jgi:hypothetical protein